MSTVCTLIPVYNEVTTLPEVLEKLLRLEVITEVIVVDDGSTDGTREILKGYQNTKVRVFYHDKNQGKTAAIQTALTHATAEICLIQDADLEYNPEEIPALLAPILNGKADVVYGSRFLVRKESRVLYFYHYLANKFLTFLCNLLTNLNMTDIQTGYKAFKRLIVRDLQLTASGFGLEVELTVIFSRVGARVYEVPISYYGRTYEEGKKIGFKDGVAAIGYILMYNFLAAFDPQKKAAFERIRQKLRV